jgi:hypothetical protein
MKNIKFIKYKDYSIDSDIVKILFGYVKKLLKISKDLQLDIILIGHISLILLSKKVYRTPKDIDILVEKHHFLKLAEGLKPEWHLGINSEYRPYFNKFMKNKLIKFASDDITNCSEEENFGTLYKIENIFNIYKKYDVQNLISPQKDVPFEPKWLCHNPNQTTHHQLPFVEKKNNLFKIRFYTNEKSNFFRAGIIFYDNNLQYKKIIECEFDSNINVNNNIYSYWSSPFLDFEQYNFTYYRIFVLISEFQFIFKHKKTENYIDCYIENDIENFFEKKVSCLIEKTIDSQKNKILFSFNNKIIHLANPHYSLAFKYNREKDFDDLEFYKDLLLKYPLRLD